MTTTPQSIVRDHQPLYVLVDYDNVVAADRAKGIDFVIEKLLDTIAVAAGSVLPENVRFRFYGGWYRNSNMTRQAQELVRTSNYFASPIPRTPTGVAPSRKIRLMAELARTLLSVSCNRTNTDIINTCRVRPFPKNRYRIDPFRHPQCQQKLCFQDDLRSFFCDGLCPYATFDIDISTTVTCEEQKLVDVMLATDLMHLAFSEHSRFAALVSSDDDMWPAIIETANTGMILFHIHTRSRSGLDQYEHFVRGPRYIATTLA